ncbi:FIVAR domain-containing protein [Lentilactobacillus kisonensis]|uniref:FIVAR domain-containing protein n=1 Tax=Lentilactobacillus kisonensis TaxID=481722 RepID=UPI0006D18C21|nr:FIVAR domain-containing protein [Lentilactobacillus kisonensis]
MGNLSAAVSGLVKAASLTDLSFAINTAKVTYQATGASANYASSTWGDFSSAYVYATSVLNNAGATADQISNATASLNKAYQALFGNGKDTYTSSLSDAISGGTTLLNAGSGSAFDASTTGALSSAITSATAVLSDSASTPDKLAAASAAITSAINDLKTTFQVTIDSLDQFINTASGISSAGSNGVTTDSYKVLSAALANAQYARYNDSNASTLASDTAKLTTAIWATVPTDASAAAYKNQLKTALSAAQSTASNSTVMSGVSSDSITNLKNAIQTAINTLNSGTTDAGTLQTAYNTVNFYTANLSKTGGGSISLNTGVYFYVYGTNNDLKDDSLESQATNTINASAGTITFGDASSISNLLSVGNGYTTTFTLPTTLTTFFNSSDWQKYVTASYYEAGGSSSAGTGMKSVTSGGINILGTTVSVLDTTKTTTLANAINTGDFQVTTSVNSQGQTVFTVNSKVIGGGTTAAGYVFTLNLKTWSADTGTYLQRVTLASDASQML